MSLLTDLINLDLSDTTEKIIAEYIWVGGSGMDMRSKARTLPGPVTDPSKLPKWNYDGSSTGQAPGQDSEVILYPQAIFKDPFRRGNNILVMCDAYTPAGDPIPTNKRHAASEIFSNPDVVAEVPWYGIEQEYTLLQKDVNWPLGWPIGGFPGPQGPYYCSIGADKSFGRDIVDSHYKACLYAGINISGINGEVMPGQWEFQVGLQLKPEALNALKLPVRVKAGFLGSVKLKVPWTRLGQEPVVVYLDRIFVLAEPATDVEGCSEDSIQEAKRNLIRDMETKLVEKSRRLQTEMNKSWMGSLVNTVIGNLKLSVSNIHIRYEDLESNPGHPFSAGVTLEKLSAVTIDDSGKETFVTGGTLDSIQKSVELDRLAFYLDSDMIPWHIDKPWENLLPSEWDQIFRFGTKDGKPADCLTRKHFYILQPVSGNAKYSKTQANESSNVQPLQKAYVNLDDVTLCLSKGGYRDVMKLADNFAAFNQRLKYAHYRPSVPVKTDARSWWKYACRVVSEQIKIASGRMSWEHVLKYTRLRKRYITHYASLLKSDISKIVVDDNEEIEALDRELNTEVILQWRMLAHKFVERSVQAENYVKMQQAKSSWWPFGGKSQVSEDEGEAVQFTDEDWERLKKVIGYKEGDEQSVISNAKPDALHTFLEVHMRRNATKLYDGEKECLAELSCEDLNCSIKLFPETKIADIKLGRYRLSSPNGLLAESAPASHSDQWLESSPLTKIGLSYSPLV